MKRDEQAIARFGPQAVSEGSSNTLDEPPTTTAEQAQAESLARPASTMAASSIVALALMPLSFLLLGIGWNWRLPGLYMDSINPEYLSRWVLTGDTGLRWIMPGNQLFGRVPLFTGTIYHGSTQLYFSLPFFQIFGIGLGQWRLTQFVVAALIVVAVVSCIIRSGGSTARTSWLVAFAVSSALVLDPGFILGLRTQAYSTIFAVGVVLASVVVILPASRSSLTTFRLLTSGFMYGLSAFTYFITWMFLPAILWIVWLRNVHAYPRRQYQIRLWVFGVAIGYLPFVLGIALIVKDRGFVGATDYLRHMGENLDIEARQSGLADRIRHVLRTTKITLDGDWVSETIVARPAGTAGTVRASVGTSIILVGVLLGLRRTSEHMRVSPVITIVALLTSFWVAAVGLGDRLQGHHYAALLPVWYLGIALGLLEVIEATGNRVRMRTSPRASAIRQSTFGLVSAVIAALLLSGMAGQRDLQRQIVHSGGAGLFSSRVTELAYDLDRGADGATVFVRDWGFAFTIQFLAGANTHVIDVAPTPEAINAHVCRTGMVIVVTRFPGSVDASRVAAQSQTIVVRDEIWKANDGTPLFQTSWFRAPETCTT